MSTNTQPLQFFSLPGHRCKASKSGWSGRYLSLKLRHGVELNIVKLTIEDEQTNIFTSTQDDADYIACCIVLKGQLNIRFPDKEVTEIQPQKFSLFSTQALNFRVIAPEQDKLYLLTYCFPKKFFNGFLKGSNSPLKDCFNSRDHSGCRYRGMPINRDILRTVAEIMSSRLTGTLRDLYLEGAVLQILSLQVDYLQRLPAPEMAKEQPVDTDPIQAAHDYLLSDIINPPSNKQVAEKVGLGEKRLCTEFKTRFGASIYDTLLARRMNMAAERLEKEDIALNRLARSVGYKHVSNFISAFTRYHGLPPKAYIRRSKAG